MARGKVKTYKEQKFDLSGLDGISGKQLEEHLALYAGYVKQVNALNEELAKLRSEGKASGKNPEFAELTRRLSLEYDGMILHEYYFSNLRRAAEPQPPAGSALGNALTESFGSIEHIADHFETLMAESCPRFPSREAWDTYVESETDRLVLLMAHLEQAWIEAKRTPDDEIRRAAKAPRRQAEIALPQ